jgi:hypothetical protein
MPISPRRRPVVHHHGLAQQARQRLGDGAARDVGRAARWKGHHQAQRAGIGKGRALVRPRRRQEKEDDVFAWQAQEKQEAGLGLDPRSDCKL